MTISSCSTPKADRAQGQTAVKFIATMSRAGKRERRIGTVETSA
jgi:hypothetical protein